MAYFINGGGRWRLDLTGMILQFYHDFGLIGHPVGGFNPSEKYESNWESWPK